MDNLDLSRRDFIKVSSVMPLSLMSGSAMAQQISQEPRNVVKPVAWLLGTVDRSPNDIPALEPGGEFFETSDRELELYAYIYQQPNGDQWYITEEHNEWKQIRMNPETQTDEVRVEDFTSFFDHTFARPEAPDDKNWNYTDADITKFDAEIELAGTTLIETTQHGNYPPGTEAIAGWGYRITGSPTAGEARAGYFNSSNGFGTGEDTTDSFVFLRKAGTDYVVYREDWNGYVPSERVWVSDEPVINRSPHLFYGGGSIKMRTLIHDGTNARLRTLHTFTPENTPDNWTAGPPFDQPNLPVTFQTNGLTGGSLRATAAHYEYGDTQSESRITGEHFFNVTVPTTDWVPIMSWRKRTGWEGVNVKPLKIAASATTNDIKLELQLDTTLTNATFSLPVHTTSDESAVEVTQDGNQGTISTNGERRWVGYANAGQANKGGEALSTDLDFNLPNEQVVTLAAQAEGGEASAAGAIAWQEFF